MSKHLLAAEKKSLKKYAVTTKPADAMANLHFVLIHGYESRCK